MKLHETYTLNNGLKIPKIGFGTAPLKGDEAYNAVMNAIKAGYRHIDTAQVYGNESDVGRAIKDSGIPRENLFITTKLDSRIKNYDDALDAFHASLKRLGLTYVDLYLIHAPWPFDDIGSVHNEGNVAVWKAFEELYEEGYAKAIGVSNFDVDDLQFLLPQAVFQPAVNQIKRHIGFPQQAIETYCKNHGILVEAYSPLGRGAFFDDATVLSYAQEHGVHPAQIALAYLLQKDLLPLPRSKNPEHIKVNGTIDFTLSDDAIDALDRLRFD